MENACACSGGDERGGICALQAVEEISAVPFLDNEAFVTLRQLESELAMAGEGHMEQPSRQTEPNLTSREETTIDKEHLVPAKMFDSFLKSLMYRAAAEDNMEMGRIREAKELFGEAYDEVLACNSKR